MSKKALFFLIFFITIIVILVALVAYQFGKIEGKKEEILVCPPKEIDFSLFCQAYYKLLEDFFDPKRILPQKIIQGAISGMVKSLEDPYTVFFNPEETKKFEQDTKGFFEGIGMEIGIKEGQLTVIAPLEGTPAQKAGIKPGDKILKIDNVLTSEITIDEAVSLIRGKRGTEVTLTIFRKGWQVPKEFKIKRAIIEIPSLKWEILEKDIIYLRLYHFLEKTPSDFKKTVEKILKSKGKKIILDLRNNSGGYLEVAQEIGSWFLKKGEILAIEDFGKEKKECRVFGNEKLLPYPLVILINQGSASAAEILAGALRDNRKILLVGETSFGKGSIQRLRELKDGSSLKITIGKWLTPKGELIEEKGIKPDIEVKMTEKDYQEEKDPQLEKAIEILKDL